MGNKLNGPKIFQQWHFDVNHKDKHYEYEEQYTSNDFVF